MWEFIPTSLTATALRLADAIPDWQPNQQFHYVTHCISHVIFAIISFLLDEYLYISFIISIIRISILHY
jgi:hypothetical protein